MSVAAARAMGALASITALVWSLAASAQTAPATPTVTPPATPLGPINADLPPGGDSYRRAIVQTPVVTPNWTLSAWVQPRGVMGKGTTMLIGGFGDPTRGPRRYLALVDGQPALVTEAGVVQGGGTADRNKWTHIAASYDGKVVRLFVNGRQVVQRGLSLEPVTGVATLAVHACTDGAHRLHAAALTRKPAAESGGLDPVRFVARQGAAAVAAARAWLARRRAARRDVDEPLLPDDTPLAAAT